MEQYYLIDQQGNYIVQQDGSRIIIYEADAVMNIDGEPGIEKIAIQKKESSTNSSLEVLRQMLYAGNGKMLSQNDAVRAYLQSQLGVTKPQSIGDLWRLFFISKGVTNRVSLTDMAKDFFNNVGF